MDVAGLLKEGQTVQIHPSGNSMFPLFSDASDYAIVKPVSGKLKKLDVAVYRNNDGILVIHRIARVREEGLFFAGDRQTALEGPLSPDRVYGVMTHYIKKGKKHSVRSPFYILYSAVWLILRPVRQRLFDIAHFLFRRNRKH